jgi:hypothetical protein
MVDKAALFHELTTRNELRRIAKLPLLNIPAEFREACQSADQDSYHWAVEALAVDQKVIRRAVVEDMRCELGMGPDWRPHGLMLLAVADEVERRVEEIMELRHGVTPPSHAAAGATRNRRSDRY